MIAYEDNEEILFKHNAKFKNNSGELIITNIRSIFISSSLSLQQNKDSIKGYILCYLYILAVCNVLQL